MGEALTMIEREDTRDEASTEESLSCFEIHDEILAMNSQQGKPSFQSLRTN